MGAGKPSSEYLSEDYGTHGPSATRSVSLVTTQKTRGLSPLASLCLGAVRGWLKVVSRGRGGELRNGVPYTRLKASELQAQLASDYQVDVSTKTVQRALTQLVTSGHLSRRQLYKHRYNRTYWYAPGEREQQAEQHRPRSVAARFHGGSSSAPKQSPQSSQQGGTERSPVSLQALKAQLTYSPLNQTSSQTAKQPQPGEIPGDPPAPRQEVVSKGWGQRATTPPKPVAGGHSSRLQQAQNALGLLVERAQRLQNRGSGSGFRSVEAQKPVAVRAQTAQAAGFLR